MMTMPTITGMPTTPMTSPMASPGGTVTRPTSPVVSSKSRTVIHTHRGMVAIMRIEAMTVSTIDSGTLPLAR